MLEPVLDYILAKKIERDSGVVTTTDITDTHQYYEVLAVGEGRWEYDRLIKPSVEVGDKVYIQKHGDADTPKELDSQGLALFMASRVMAKETK